MLAKTYRVTRDEFQKCYYADGYGIVGLIFVGICALELASKMVARRTILGLLIIGSQSKIFTSEICNHIIIKAEFNTY